MITILLGSQVLPAQDLHFSQFNQQPALINPALTGASAPLRASLAYRDQWRSVASPYTTLGASVETRFRSSNWEQVDQHRTMTFKQRSLGRLAAGISVYKDNAGDGSMSTTQANLSLATFIPTGPQSFVSVGLQGSMVQRRLDNSKLLFPNQYNGSFYDPSQQSTENLQRQNYTYADFGAGALWSYGQNDKNVVGNRELKANLGFSVYHLARPSDAYLQGGNDALYRRYVFHGDLLIGLHNRDYAIVPSCLFQIMGPSNELIAGLLLKRYFKVDSKYTGNVKRSSFGLGGYIRNRDAAIMNVMLEWKQELAIGMSYDINLSRLATGINARGGTELTLRFTPPNAFLYQKKPDP